MKRGCRWPGLRRRREVRDPITAHSCGRRELARQQGDVLRGNKTLDCWGADGYDGAHSQNPRRMHSKVRVAIVRSS